MHPHEFIDEVESDAYAVLCIDTLVESCEEVFLFFFWNSDASIFYDYSYLLGIVVHSYTQGDAMLAHGVFEGI